MLDMEGVFSTASTLVEQPANLESNLIQQEASGTLKHDIGLGALEVKNLVNEAGLKPSEIELIMTGKPMAHLSSKEFADSVLFGLSDEDREVLQKINHI